MTENEGGAMDTAAVLAYCMAKPHTREDFPFGAHCLCVKLCGRIVAQLFVLRGVPSVTLKCEREGGVFWRLRYPEVVVRGYYCPPVQQPYWNTLPLTGAVEDGDLCAMIDEAYAAVVRKLPRAQRALLAQENEGEASPSVP